MKTKISFATITFCLIAASAALGQEKSKLTAEQQCEATKNAAMERITVTYYGQIEPQIIDLREVMERNCTNRQSVQITLAEVEKKFLELRARSVNDNAMKGGKQ